MSATIDIVTARAIVGAVEVDLRLALQLAQPHLDNGQLEVLTALASRADDALRMLDRRAKQLLPVNDDIRTEAAFAAVFTAADDDMVINPERDEAAMRWAHRQGYVSKMEKTVGADKVTFWKLTAAGGRRLKELRR